MAFATFLMLFFTDSYNFTSEKVISNGLECSLTSWSRVTLNFENSFIINNRMLYSQLLSYLAVSGGVSVSYLAVSGGISVSYLAVSGGVSVSSRLHLKEWLLFERVAFFFLGYRQRRLSLISISSEVPEAYCPIVFSFSIHSSWLSVFIVSLFILIIYC